MPVLIAIDDPSQAEAPLNLGAQVAVRGHEPLTLLTVIRHESERPAAGAMLARACEVLQDYAPAVRTQVRVGHPATEIVCEAEEGDYDLVIIGEGPHRNLMTRILHGSTAVRIVEHAPCPVILAKGKIGPLQRVLLCDSGSRDPAVGLASNSHARPALGTGRPGRLYPSVLSRFTELSVDLLDGTGEIVVLHVMSQMSAGPGVPGKQLRSDTEGLVEERAPEGELLLRDIEALQRLGIRARPKVRHGLVVEEIMDEVHRGDYDLVVIGAYRGEGWQRILLDDLAHRIIVELDRPVLVVR